MQEITRAIGKRIKQAREERGITQKQMGEYLGYSAMGISHFESGDRDMRISDLRKLADFFGKDISFFLNTGQVLFRAQSSLSHNEDGAVQSSLDAFDKFLQERKQR